MCESGNTSGETEDAVSRRTVIATAGAATTIALAGCGGSGGTATDEADPTNTNGEDGTDGTPDQSNEGSDSTPDQSDGGDETPTPSGPDEKSDVTGVSGESAVDGLAVADVEQRDSEDYFTAIVTVRNAGERSTDPYKYGYDVTLYDAEGNDITGGATGKRLNESEIDAGMTALATITASVDGSVSDIAGATVALTCNPDNGESGVYCSA